MDQDQVHRVKQYLPTEVDTIDKALKQQRVKTATRCLRFTRRTASFPQLQLNKQRTIIVEVLLLKELQQEIRLLSRL